jgi:hypothetical protein
MVDAAFMFLAIGIIADGVCGKSFRGEEFQRDAGWIRSWRFRLLQ